MFAIVRTGGKQYRVAAGDKIVIDKIDGEAGARVQLSDVLFVSDGSTPPVAAEIIAQAKADKVIVFKKKRRHNYRRKAGHRQQHTILKIVSVGDDTGEQRAQTTEPVASPVQPEPVAAEYAPETNVSATPIVNADEAVAQEPLKAGPTENAPATPAALQE